MADKFDELRLRAAYTRGREAGVLMKLKRRVSLPAPDLVKWQALDLEAFVLGCKEGAE